MISVEDTIAALIALEQDGFASEAVQAYLLATRLAPRSLLPYVHFDRSHYTRNLIHRTDGFELLAICWNIGQAAPIHDHEDQRCWARVEQGTLRFTNYHLVSEHPLQLTQASPAITGGPGHLDALAGIHRVANDRSFGQPAVSLHLYARPFPECTIYDLTQGEKRRRKLSYDTVPASLDRPGAGRA
jgi:cysteine dioxygenase